MAILCASKMPDAVADHIDDGLELQLRSQGLLHAADDRQLGVPLTRFLMARARVRAVAMCWAANSSSWTSSRGIADALGVALDAAAPERLASAFSGTKTASWPARPDQLELAALRPGPNSVACETPTAYE